MKYKVGDKVKVREDLKADVKYDDVWFIKEMEKLKGTYVTISRVHEKDNYYEVKEGLCSFSDGMFEDIKKENENKVMHKKPILIDYKVYNNKTVVLEYTREERVTSVCHEEDQFDFNYGVGVCVLKHVLGEKGYKNFLKEYERTLKQIKNIDREKEEKKKEEELIAKRKAKAAQKKARHQENRRKRRIAEMQEAILGALKEHDGDKSFYSYFGIPASELYKDKSAYVNNETCTEDSFDDLK